MTGFGLLEQSPFYNKFRGLVACGGKKYPQARPARSLYKGAQVIVAAKWVAGNFADNYILSAKHGLLPFAQVTEPYDCTLLDFTEKQKRRWALMVSNQMAQLEGNKPFLFLGSKLYLESMTLVPFIKLGKIITDDRFLVVDAYDCLPDLGKTGIRGKRMAWLNRNKVLTAEMARKWGVA